jgi:glycosyltransferase involved in cell wall biosynthesis
MSTYGIVIPCFNEGQRLNSSLFVEFLKHHENIFFVFVNDGSTDNTHDLLMSMADECSEMIHIAELKSNSGKAEAIRCGINYILKNNKAPLVGYWDADLSTPLSEIPRFIHFLTEHQKILFLMGSRVKRLGTNIKRSEIRHYFGRIFATAVSIILKLPVYDTQCGAKLIRRELAEKIFREQFISRWLFDVELIARVIDKFGHFKAIGYIYEFPLNIWIDEGKSKVKTIDFLRAPYELILIRYKYRAAFK